MDSEPALSIRRRAVRPRDEAERKNHHAVHVLGPLVEIKDQPRASELNFAIKVRSRQETRMKFMVMGLEPRGEWERLDDEEMNRRVRHHQQKLDELVMARALAGPPGLIFASVGLSEERRRSIEHLLLQCSGIFVYDRRIPIQGVKPWPARN